VLCFGISDAIVLMKTEVSGQITPEVLMRSELILSVKAKIPNRFLLANLVTKGARRLHRPGNRIEDTTNDVLLHLSRCKPSQAFMQPGGLHFRGDAAGCTGKSQIHPNELPSLRKLGLRMPYERPFEYLE
jgi:hypothetical protein